MELLIKDFRISLSSIHSSIMELYNNHLSFHASYFGMNYSNITGFILLLSLTIQFFSGLLPSSYYEDYVVLRFDPAYYIELCW